jgi:hypothetical protein
MFKTMYSGALMLLSTSQIRMALVSSVDEKELETIFTG